MENCRIAYQQNIGSKMVIKRVMIPQCGKDEMLLKILYAGICRTDIQFYTGQRKNGPPILGHECLAEVIKTGHEIKEFFPGEMITINPNNPFDEEKKIGHIPELPGIFQDYYLVSPELIKNNQIIKLAKIHKKEAVLLEGLSCVVNAQERVKEFIQGKTVLIIGAGIMGQLHVLCAKANKAKEVFLMNRSMDKLQDAVNRGTIKKENILLATHESSTELSKLTSHKMPDLIIVIVSMDQGLPVTQKAIDYVADGGAIYLFGGFRETDICSLPNGRVIPFGDIRIKSEKIRLSINEKNITFAGSRGSLFVHWRKAVSLVEENKISLKKLITHTIPFDYLPNAFTQLSNGNKLDDKICLKAVIDMKNKKANENYIY